MDVTNKGTVVAVFAGISDPAGGVRQLSSVAEVFKELEAEYPGLVVTGNSGDTFDLSGNVPDDRVAQALRVLFGTGRVTLGNSDPDSVYQKLKEPGPNVYKEVFAATNLQWAETGEYVSSKPYQTITLKNGLRIAVVPLTYPDIGEFHPYPSKNCKATSVRDRLEDILPHLQVDAVYLSIHQTGKQILRELDGLTMGIPTLALAAHDHQINKEDLLRVPNSDIVVATAGSDCKYVRAVALIRHEDGQHEWQDRVIEVDPAKRDSDIEAILTVPTSEPAEQKTWHASQELTWPFNADTAEEKPNLYLLETHLGILSGLAALEAAPKADMVFFNNRFIRAGQTKRNIPEEDFNKSHPARFKGPLIVVQRTVQETINLLNRICSLENYTVGADHHPDPPVIRGRDLVLEVDPFQQIPVRNLTLKGEKIVENGQTMGNPNQIITLATRGYFRDLADHQPSQPTFYKRYDELSRKENVTVVAEDFIQVIRDFWSRQSDLASVSFGQVRFASGLNLQLAANGTGYLLPAGLVNAAYLKRHFDKAATKLFDVYDNPELQKMLQAAKELLPQGFLTFEDQVEFREAVIAPLLHHVYTATQQNWSPAAYTALRQLFHFVVHTKLDEKGEAPPPFPDMANFRVVIPGKLWAGSEPTQAGLEGLIREHGINCIVSLRSENLQGIKLELYPNLKRFQIPIMDGGIPKSEQAHEFLSIVGDPQWRIYVCCNAGIGRTGVMVALAEIEAGLFPVEEAIQRALLYRVKATLTPGQQDFIRNFGRV